MSDPEIEILDDDFNPAQLKKVSRIKHHVLAKYLPAWQIILGSRHNTLNYLDCYAGPGRYVCEGETVDGSPVIAVRVADQYLNDPRNSDKRIQVFLVERDAEQLVRLKRSLNDTGISNSRLDVVLFNQDSADYVPRLLEKLTDSPSFFMIDPYAHPLTVPIINRILSRDRSEALINFMYYRINMDASNPKVTYKVDELFGHTNWQSERFLSIDGIERERALLTYFLSEVKAKYKFPFRIKFDPTDKVRGDRTKYYLVHASNHVKAVLLMKDVMWPLADAEGLFEYGGTDTQQLTLFSPEDRLRQRLLDEFVGTRTEFDELRENTWHWPFIEKHYRAALKKMQRDGEVDITPVSSKTKAGLRGRDIMQFKSTQQKSLFSM